MSDPFRENAVYDLDLLHQHEISEAGHRILNPFTERQLMQLGEVSRIGAATRILDLACGKGEMLCRWSAAFGAAGHGVDISEVFIPLARARATELGVADRVSFTLGDAASFQPGARYDVVSCIGATWIGGGLGGTIELMHPSVTPGGLLLIGEPYWTEDPPQAACQALGFEPGEFTSLAGTLRRFEAAGLGLVEMVLADGESWDRYVASQWWTVHEWLTANPGHPDATMMRDYLRASRESYLTWNRRYLGWGVFVLRP
jgi:SAM-dependent methyltransferase